MRWDPTAWVERLWFDPGPGARLLSYALLPLAGLYGTGMALRRKLARRRSFGLPIVSVGNLLVGGTGKTPFLAALAGRYEGVWIVSRGYGRRSRGLVTVSKPGKILASVAEAGDEAMLLARKLPRAGVIVAENRAEGIEAARRQGARLLFLDDGFNRVGIEKFEILLEPAKLPNRFVIPAGPFREFPSTARRADLHLKEGRDFHREVHIEGARKRMLLATAIARPERLEPWLPEGVVDRLLLPDHGWFDEERLQEAMERCGAESLLVTEKDAVKMEGFKLPLSLMRLELCITDAALAAVDAYVKDAYAT